MSLKREEKDKIKDFLLKTIYYAENYFNIFVIITERTTKEIFDEYTSDDFVFNKTKITVHLAKDYLGHDFVSRSLAKRILMNVEKFKIIVLDFENIDNIGQGFADDKNGTLTSVQAVKATAVIPNINNFFIFFTFLK